MSEIKAIAGCRSDAGTYQQVSMRVKELVHQEQITVKSSKYAADLIRAYRCFRSYKLKCICAFHD